MVPLFVMLVAIGTARAVGAWVWAPLDDWRAAVRVGLAVMFLFTGLAHFARTRPDLIRMVPPRLRFPALLVTLTGLAEFAGAAGLLHTATAPLAAYGLMLLLIAMFPANVYASRMGHTTRGRPHTPLAIRLPLQLLWIALLWWSISGTA